MRVRVFHRFSLLTGPRNLGIEMESSKWKAKWNPRHLEYEVVLERPYSSCNSNCYLFQFAPCSKCSNTDYITLVGISAPDFHTLSNHHYLSAIVILQNRQDGKRAICRNKRGRTHSTSQTYNGGHEEFCHHQIIYYRVLNPILIVSQPSNGYLQLSQILLRLLSKRDLSQDLSKSLGLQ